MKHLRNGIRCLLLCAVLALSMCLGISQDAYAYGSRGLTGGRSHVVVLDPGHGGTDGGACRIYDGTTIAEKDLNLKIAQACKKELETYSNVTVYMTRDSDRYLCSSRPVQELQARCDYANSAGADLYVSLHINSASGSSRGSTVFIPVPTVNSYGNSFHNEMKDLGEDILDHLQGLGLANDGTKFRYFDTDDDRDYYAVIRHCKEYNIPAVIVEHAFLDNSSDYYGFLASDDSLASMGKADADGIAKYLGLQKRGSESWEGRHPAGQWQAVNGKGYHFHSAGNVQTGWLNLDGTWYYLGGNGIMQTGWQYINGVWYYFRDDGSMATGWQYVKGAWYYLNSNGAMSVGWIYTDGTWYFMNGDGVMMSGWQKVDGTWYYLTGSGAMAHGEYYDGYWLNDNGSWTYPDVASWKWTDGRWWYGDDTGWYAKNEMLSIDGTEDTFDSEGYLTN